MMKNIRLTLFAVVLLSLTTTSCVSKKKYMGLEDSLKEKNKLLAESDAKFAEYFRKYENCEAEKAGLQNEVRAGKENTRTKEVQIETLRDQIDDLKKMRDKQVEMVGDLTVLSKSANENVKETLVQLEEKDKYIRLIQAAKTKADSINLALAVNLKGVLSQGLDDTDVEIKVDKTVVMINLSDKMLYNSGSATLTNRANDVLGKIATILKTKPDLEVMVEGYTDNVPISNDCIKDNWDLSVKRSTAVVRKLQKDFGIDPNRLIAAGRGEYNTLASNATSDGRAINRRTRIIIMPKLDQFYDLLDPTQANAKIK